MVLQTGSIMSLLLFAITAFTDTYDTLPSLRNGMIPKGDYIVTSTITIPKGSTLSFAGGSIVRFIDGTGIEIQGGLICRGTALETITFTGIGSGNEKRPWSGITQADSISKLLLDYVRILHASTGIRLQTAGSSVAISNVVFTSNDTALTIAGTVIDVQNNRPFTLHTGKTGTSLGLNSGTLESESEKRRQERLTYARWSLAGLGSLSLVSTVAMHLRAAEQQESYIGAPDRPTAITMKNRRDQSVIIRNISAGVAAFALAGFTVTLFF